MGSVQQAWPEAVFVDGEFRRLAGGGTSGVHDKASGQIFAASGLAGEADVADAVAVAKAAQPAWAERTYARRGSAGPTTERKPPRPC